MVRGLTLVLTVLTGFSGLVYEVTWQKGLAILLGSHSEATAAVLALFLGGLSLGYALFGRLVSRTTARRGVRASAGWLLLCYGFIEASIGIWALVWPNLFEIARTISSTLPLRIETVSFGFDLLLTLVLIGPPTVLMGGTIPILTQALSRDLADATRFHAFVYGFNTLGAFAGALAGGFFLVPWLGIPGTLTAMGFVNLAVGATFVALYIGNVRAGEPKSSPASVDLGTDSAPVSSPPPRFSSTVSFAPFATVAVLLGFAMMAIQTVLIRVGGLSLGASHFSFSMLVATFVLCIAVGSLVVSLREHIPVWLVTACPLALGILLCLLYPLIDDAPYAAHVLRSLFRSIDQAFYPFHLAVSVGLVLVLGLPIGLSGASLPLLFHALRDEMGGLGGLAGRLYGWNTVGNLLGALLGGYVLLFWVDLHHVYRMAVMAILIAAGILLVRLGGLSRLRAAGVIATLVLALVLWPPWDPRHLSAGFFRLHKVLPATFEGPAALLAVADPLETLFYDDDPTTTVSVIEYTRAGQTTRAILTNGKNDGSLLFDYPTMALAGLMPCLFASQCRKAFVIGLGTGVTAGELGGLEGMERVKVSEISPGVMEAARFFEHGNRGVSKNDKIEIVRSDAYRALLHSDERWDVIASEPSNPWVVGVEMLFSREFLEAARDHLEEGGVYAQWMHTYEMDDDTLELVLRTYASVFDRVAVWYAHSYDLLLLGFKDDAATPDLERIAERFARSDFKQGLARSGILTLEELLAHELIPVGLVTPDALPGEVHTLLHPRLSHQAALAFFTGGDAELPYLAAHPSTPSPGLLERLVARDASRPRNDEDPTSDVVSAAPEASPRPGRKVVRAPPVGGWKDEAVRERIVNEVCDSRPRECAVLIARWLHDEPDSPLVRDAIERHRSRSALREHLEAWKLDVLASFFGEGPSRLAAEEIEPVTELYFDYYHHALPFRPDALRRAWRGCISPECARLRQASERRLRGRSGASHG